LGGVGDDFGFDIALDGDDKPHVTGQTYSSDFPISQGAFDASFGGDRHAFVAKLDPSSGTPLAYSTYLGGPGNDLGQDLALDSMGNVHVTGRTGSSDFPTAPGALDCTLGGPLDGFYTVLDPVGAILQSTYLGGRGTDYGAGIALDPLGNASSPAPPNPGYRPLQAPSIAPTPAARMRSSPALRPRSPAGHARSGPARPPASPPPPGTAT
jgi:Beta-propeller repeat